MHSQFRESLKLDLCIVLLDQFVENFSAELATCRTPFAPQRKRFTSSTWTSRSTCHEVWTGQHKTFASLTKQQNPAVNPPDAESKHGGEHKAGRREQQPIPAHPENEACIATVPRVAHVSVEETPAVAAVLVGHEHAHTTGPFLAVGAGVGQGGVFAHPFLPHDREEKRTSRGHDSDVRQKPPLVGALQ